MFYYCLELFEWYINASMAVCWSWCLLYHSYVTNLIIQFTFLPYFLAPLHLASYYLHLHTSAICTHLLSAPILYTSPFGLIHKYTSPFGLIHQTLVRTSKKRTQATPTNPETKLDRRKKKLQNRTQRRVHRNLIRTYRNKFRREVFVFNSLTVKSSLSSVNRIGGRTVSRPTFISAWLPKVRSCYKFLFPTIKTKRKSAVLYFSFSEKRQTIKN